MQLAGMGMWWVVALATAPSSPEPARTAQGESTDQERPGKIVLGPAARGRAVIVSEDGDVVAHVTLVPGRATTVGVPAGRYRIESEGRRVAELEVGSGETFEMASPPVLAAPVPPPTVAAAPASARHCGQRGSRGFRWRHQGRREAGRRWVDL